MLRTAACVCALILASLGLCTPYDLSADTAPVGVRHALDQLRTISAAPVSAEVAERGDDLVPGGSEAFSLEPADAGYRLRANAPAGLMYGLLELRDRLKLGQPPAAKVLSAPALSLRGDVLDFPFYLGVDLYGGRWRWHQDIEAKADSWWLDRGHWAWRLKRCAELRINSLLICHPHPFPALIDLPGGASSAYFAPEHLKRLHDHFAWILDEAAQYGVRVYFLTWNIWVSPGFAKAHGIAQEGPDGPEVRQYTRECYRRLFEAYPRLAGVMTMAGEAPPGCVDFVREGVVEGLNQLPNPPELLFWIWCSYPEDARRIFADYKGKSVLVHYLQYEQLFRPQADPRIRRASEALGGVPVVTLGGLGTATGWLYWSDPYYIRDIMADLPRQNGVGCFFQGLDSFSAVAEKWLGWDALGRYGWDASLPREDEYWQARIEDHLSAKGVGADFLSASIAASAIPTRLLALLHRQTDHFMPQFGLPLVQYLGLPTLSTYVFENHERVDERGRLWPRLGLTWPNPDWGEKVVGVCDFVAGRTDGTTPLQIADELEAAARTVEECVSRLRAAGDTVAGGAEKWGQCLDQMMLNAHLGRHTAEKIRAAVAWERWKKGGATPAQVLEPLERSVRAIEAMAQIAASLYRGMGIETWRPGISRPVPWSHLQVWTTDRYRKWDFADSAAAANRELEWIAKELSAGNGAPLLPFEDDLLPPPSHASLLARWDFEGDPPPGIRLGHYGPQATAVVGGGEAPLPLLGKRLVATHSADAFWFPLTTDPAMLPLKPGRWYRLTADYWIAADAEANGDWLSAGARTTEGGWQQDVGARYMGGKAGTRGCITLTLTPGEWQDYHAYVSIHGRARVELDNLELWEGDAP